MPRKFTRPLAGFLLACAFAITCSKAFAETAYTIELAIYRVTNTPVDILDEAYVQRAAFNPDIEKKLAQPIRWAMDDMHVQAVLDFFTTSSGLQFHAEPGLIAPPPKRGEARTGEYFTSGMLPPIMIERGTARTALQEVLQQLGLDFVVEADRIRIDTADKLRGEPGFRTYTPTPLLKLVNEGAASIGESLVRLGVDDSVLAQDLLTSPDVRCWGRPTITVFANQESVISIDDQARTEYLEPKPRSDNKEFVLRNDLENTGITAKVRVNDLPDGKINLSFKLNARYIGDREPLPGTTVRAGKPNYRQRNIMNEFSLEVDRRSLILARVTPDTGDTIAIFTRIHRIDTANLPQVNAVTSFQYSLSTHLLKVRGEPDWQFWMQPYARRSNIFEGAGRVLGPVEVARVDKRPKTFDWRRLGFDKVKESEPANADPGGMVHVVDSQFSVGAKQNFPFTLEATNEPAQNKPIDPAHPVFEAFRQVAPDAPPLKPDDIQGQPQSLSITSVMGENGQPHSHCEFLAYGGAERATGGMYRVERRVLTNTPHVGSKDALVRRELRFSCETDNDAMFAYLIPIADDEYWIVLNDFQLAKE